MILFSFVYLFLSICALIMLHSYMFKLFALVAKDPDQYGGVKMLTVLFTLETLLVTVTFGFVVYGFIIYDKVTHQQLQEPAPIIKNIKLSPQQRII